MKRLDVYDCIKPGDWVRFQRSGQLVIGEVQYIIDHFPVKDPEFVTDAGSVPAKSILEYRRESVPDTTP